MFVQLRVKLVRDLGVIFSCLGCATVVGITHPCSAQSATADPGTQPQSSEVLEAFEIGAVEARTGALLLSGQAGGEVEGALVWSVNHQGDDGRATVPFVVEVEGASLLSGRIGRQIVIGFYAYVVDDDGKIVDHIAQGLVLESQDYKDRILSSGLKFVGRFALPPGSYALRVLVRNQRTGSFFMSWSLITLPVFDDPSPQLLPPLFPDSGLDWTLVHQAGTKSVVMFGDNAELLPSARPVLVEDRPAEVWLGGGGWDVNSRVGVRIINEHGRTVSEPVATLDGPMIGDYAYQRATLSPVDLPPGQYTLVFTLSDAQASQMLRRGLHVVLTGSGSETTWVAARSSNEGGAIQAVDQPQDSAPKVGKKEIRASYRRALFALGRGDAVTARRLVAELEREAVAGSSLKAATILGEAEYAESKELAKKDSRCLIPMALLHRELYRSYIARQERALASHSRKMAISYAEQLALLKPQNGFSESLIVNFAVDFAQDGASSTARRMLEEAIRLNQGYRPALLSLGFSFERNGDYLEASTIYRRLVDKNPGDDEGLLRLGINLIRTGHEGQGMGMLENILATDARPWVRAVAAQEIVRYLIAKGHSDEAERTARSSLELMPEDQRLRILLASILERSGKHQEAIAEVADLPAASRGVSPRARYAEWPSLGIGASQADLNKRAAEATPALEYVIAAWGGVE